MFILGAPELGFPTVPDCPGVKVACPECQIVRENYWPISTTRVKGNTIGRTQNNKILDFIIITNI